MVLKLKLKKLEDIKNIRYVNVSFKTDYWEDCRINGVVPESDDFFNPLKKDNQVNFTIDLFNGIVLDWLNGYTVTTWFKVRDEGTYKFLDHNQQLLFESDYGEYVPDFLSIDDDGYGDYVYLTINNNGQIVNFNPMDVLNYLLYNEDDS